MFMGGPSGEHEVSLNTGKEIMKNLDPKKYDAHPVVVTKNGEWLLPAQSPKLLAASTKKVRLLKEPQGLERIESRKPDAVFIAMHGAYGEDGTLQGILESAGIPYTGSGVLASALGMDKPRASAVFEKAGLLVPPFRVIKNYGGSTSIIASVIKKFGWPIVIKPSNHGSSVGVTIANNKKELTQGIREASRYSRDIILQKFIRGKEITCGVLERETGKLMPLPPIEIIPRLGKFYDYRSKYAKGGSDHIISPQWMSKKLIAQIQKAACRAHAAVGCSGMSRSDFILGKNGKIYLLEINTIPGMTQTSLLPDAARAAGIAFPELLDIIIANALLKKGGQS